MRSRGTQATDIAILVIAADEGVKEQTEEAIELIKGAKLPLIVAINKIDKPGADPEKVRVQLLKYGIVTTEHGGEIQALEISAANKINLDHLEDTILLQAQMLNLRADPEGKG